MKIAAKGILVVFFSCLFVSIATIGVAAPAITQPIYTSGDYYKYTQKYCSLDTSTGEAVMSNSTQWWNVTDDSATKWVNGTSYTVYVIEAVTYGENFIFTSGQPMRSNVYANSTLYMDKFTNGIVWMWGYYNNSMIGAPMWMDMQGVSYYSEPLITFEYPLILGNVWYSNVTYWSETLMRSDYGGYEEQWTNKTYYQNNSYEVVREESIGTYACLVVKETDLDDLGGTPYTYWWVSQIAGGWVQRQDNMDTYFMPVPIDDKNPNAEINYYYTYMEEGVYDGDPITGVPSPVLEPLWALAGIGALAFLVAAAWKRK